MVRTLDRRSAVLFVALLGVTCGCRLFKGEERELPLPPDVIPEQVIDAENPSESVTPLHPDDLAETGRKMLADRQKNAIDTGKKYNILALSGGSVYGAYSAGVLCGWSDSGLTPEQGGRPVFDVVTGISTGSLIAPFAFLGTKYDHVVRTEYTTTTTAGIYTRQNSLRRIISESIVDNTPFRQRVYTTMNDEVFRDLVAAHAAGRRLYVGTTNADTKRIVLWDIGAIATRGTPDARKLVCDVIIASASIPAFFPPVRINVNIDGRRYEELHVDGSVTRSLFFRPPMAPRGEGGLSPDRLAGSNLYVLVAGKINPAPAAVRVRTFPLALSASGTLLYSVTRGDLYRMYTYCLLTGMNLRVSAIPDDEEVPKSGTEFVPEEMTKLFNAGYVYGQKGDTTRAVATPPKDPAGKVEVEQSREGTAWRDLPPGLKNGEKQGARTGRNLTLRPREEGTGAPRGPEPPKLPGPDAPPIRMP